MGDTIHLWTAFVTVFVCLFLSLYALQYTLVIRSLSADFTGLHTYQVSLAYACRSLRGGVSGRYPFHSTSQLTSSTTNLVIAAFSSFSDL